MGISKGMAGSAGAARDPGRHAAERPGRAGSRAGPGRGAKEIPAGAHRSRDALDPELDPELRIRLAEEALGEPEPGGKGR